MSAKFVKGCYTHQKKVKLAGVVRKGGRGLPECVLQADAKNKAELRQVRGTCKAAVLKGDSKCPDMLAVSVYDSKPVYFLSMIHEKIEWVQKMRLTFSKLTAKKEENMFLRLV